MKRLCTIATLLLLAILVGCKEKDKFVLLVDHAVHVVENEMECEECHARDEQGAWIRPNHKTCNECHDDVIETKEINEKTCGYCHKQKNLSEIKNRKLKRRPSRTFVHTEALEDRCNECHAGVPKEKTPKVRLLTRRDVIAIRDKAHASEGACTDCHVNMDPEVAPSSHDKGWVRLHGIRAEQDQGACAACHHENSCRECHQSTMPASHNNLWRMRTHGFSAAWDRSRCQVCHQEDFCVACHAETRPRSHVGAWKTTHCYGCHTSDSAGTGCATCHETNPEAHPNPHEAGWLGRHCDNCHRGAPQADQCAICHPGGLGAHPNPHGAGWKSRHCVSCHLGQSDRNECAVCHPGAQSIRVHDGIWPDPHAVFVTETLDCLLCH